jgi:hypothetical protein
VKASGATGVRAYKPGVSLLRRFLPTEEGGSDPGEPFALGNIPGFVAPGDQVQIRMTRMRLYEWSMVPWDKLPQQFNPVAFPFTVGLGQTVRQEFAKPFTEPVRDPRGSRELLLRGLYAQAVTKLIAEDGDLRSNIGRMASTPDLDGKIQDWLKVAREAYVEQQRARNAGNTMALNQVNRTIDALWMKASPVAILLYGASSAPRDAEVTYQLGLCMQEQAEQRQARLDLLAKAGVSPAPSDVERCQQAWTDAKGWWERFTTDFGRGTGAPPARQNRGRAEAMLGDWKAAADTWGDLSGPMEPGDKLAALNRAREAKLHLSPAK